MIKKIEFTERAKKQIEKITSESEFKKYFRISVKGGGCSGFKYNLVSTAQLLKKMFYLTTQ